MLKIFRNLLFIGATVTASIAGFSTNIRLPETENTSQSVLIPFNVVTTKIGQQTVQSRLKVSNSTKGSRTAFKTTLIYLPSIDFGIIKPAAADKIVIIASKFGNSRFGFFGHAAIGWFDDSGNFISSVAQWPDGVRQNDKTDFRMLASRVIPSSVEIHSDYMLQMQRQRAERNCPTCNYREAIVTRSRANWIMNTVANYLAKPYFSWRSGKFYICSQYAADIWSVVTNGRERSTGWPLLLPRHLSNEIDFWNKHSNGILFNNGIKWDYS